MPFIQFQFRRGLSTEWTTANPILASGEMGIETDTDLFKIGDGSTTWNLLPYGGLQGTTGPQGVAGATGSTGIIGLTGATGQIGLTGATGIQGIIGASGSTGTIGLTGATGTQGVTGLT
ncbi:MAG: hypothetical protein ACK6DA_03075, partial [Candidatus Kapaibacterium sp.]